MCLTILIVIQGPTLIINIIRHVFPTVELCSLSYFPVSAQAAYVPLITNSGTVSISFYPNTPFSDCEAR